MFDFFKIFAKHCLGLIVCAIGIATYTVAVYYLLSLIGLGELLTTALFIGITAIFMLLYTAYLDWDAKRNGWVK